MLDKEAIKEYLIKEKQRLQDQLYAEEGIGRSISLRDNVDELSLADNHPRTWVRNYLKGVRIYP